jgi:hypothetical protein
LLPSRERNWRIARQYSAQVQQNQGNGSPAPHMRDIKSHSKMRLRY